MHNGTQRSAGQLRFLHRHRAKEKGEEGGSGASKSRKAIHVEGEKQMFDKKSFLGHLEPCSTERALNKWALLGSSLPHTSV